MLCPINGTSFLHVVILFLNAVAIDSLIVRAGAFLLAMPFVKKKDSKKQAAGSAGAAARWPAKTPKAVPVNVAAVPYGCYGELLTDTSDTSFFDPHIEQHVQELLDDVLPDLLDDCVCHSLPHVLHDEDSANADCQQAKNSTDMAVDWDAYIVKYICKGQPTTLCTMTMDEQ